MGRKYIPRYNIDESLLKKLRKDGMTYREISDYLEIEFGNRVSAPTLCKRMKEINEKEEIIKPEEAKKKEQILTAQLKSLRGQGLTYREISEALTSAGNEISSGIVRSKIKLIYSQERKNEPKAKYKRSLRLEIITDEELEKLRKKGLGTSKIQRYYNEQGIEVSRQYIWNRIKSLEKKQIQAIRADAKSKIIEKILGLQQSRKATPMQMRKMAKLYGVEVEFEDTLNNSGKRESSEECIEEH